MIIQEAKFPEVREEKNKGEVTAEPVKVAEVTEEVADEITENVVKAEKKVVKKAVRKPVKKGKK